MVSLGLLKQPCDGTDGTKVSVPGLNWRVSNHLIDYSHIRHREEDIWCFRNTFTVCDKFLFFYKNKLSGPSGGGLGVRARLRRQVLNEMAYPMMKLSLLLVRSYVLSATLGPL